MEARIAASEMISGVLSLVAAMKRLLPVYMGFFCCIEEGDSLAYCPVKSAALILALEYFRWAESPSRRRAWCSRISLIMRRSPDISGGIQMKK